MSDQENFGIQDNTLEMKKRPTVITVFGILTIIGASLAILGGLANLLMGEAQIRAYESNPLFGEDMVEMMKAIQQPVWMIAIGIIIGIVKIPAVIQLFKMKKSGFYLYTGAELVGVGIAILNALNVSKIFKEMGELSSDLAPMMGWVGMMSGVGGIVITLVLAGVWIGVYGSKLKEME